MGRTGNASHADYHVALRSRDPLDPALCSAVHTTTEHVVFFSRALPLQSDTSRPPFVVYIVSLVEIELASSTNALICLCPSCRMCRGLLNFSHSRNAYTYAIAGAGLHDLGEAIKI